MPHIHDKIDFTVEVFIVYNNKVLLRKHDKYKMWLSVGGHIELDEDPNQAAIREVKEEVGLNVKLSGVSKSFKDKNEYYELIPPKFLNRHRINKDHEHITLVYFAASDTDKLSLSDKELSEECKWFTKEELELYDIKESIKFYALQALEELKNKL
ncbi:NUDIX domain-containing protein [Candidatus Woesearchaeota archaeon]|nr:NUDIX domain-containing protein [Candidatus Woesearchaeota archaeon]